MRWARLGLPVLFLLAFGLRVYRLDFQSIWTDEGFVIGLASRTLPELVAVWNISPQAAYASLSRLGVDLVGLAAETDIHPPLYYFLVHFWLPLAGKSEFALRFPAVFFGMLIIPVLYVLGKRLAGAKAATIAGAIAALSPFYLDFSQQVRMYTLVTFLAVLSMYSFQRAFGDGRRGWWVVYALSVALALYTHYFAITIVLVQAVLVVVGIIGVRVRFTESEGTNGIRSAMGSSPGSTPGGQGRPPLRASPLDPPASPPPTPGGQGRPPLRGPARPATLDSPASPGSSLGGQGRPPPRGSARLSTLDSRLWLWLASLAGAVLLLAPWAPYALRQVFEYQNRSLLSPDWQTVLPRTWQTFNLGLAVDNSRVAPLLLAMLATLLAGLAVAWWRGGEERPGLVALSLYLVLPLLAGLAIFQLKPMFHPKYFMMASPAYYLVLGTAVWSLWRAVPWAALPAGLLIFASLAYASQSYFFDARYWKDDTRAVARYLEGRATDRDLVLSDLAEPLGYYYKGRAPAYYLPGDEGNAPQRLESIARDRGRVFLVHYEHAYTDAQG
ncbi:MAG TPA: glycosyltransferase family 39 protein, partial [Dehalococcoidia bacterium]|nr:glycosyltransferase family 39 protein [Dehalococcoidia bacterium]